MSLSGVKIQNRCISQTNLRCLTETLFLQICILSPLTRSLSLSHLYFSLRKNTNFYPLSTSFYSKGMFVFLTVGRRHVMASEKKRSILTIRTDAGAFEQYCWSNPPWGFGHWRTPDESEQERKQRKENTEGNKMCHYFLKQWKGTLTSSTRALFKMRFCLFLMKLDSLVLKTVRSGSRFPLPVILKWHHFIYI